MKSIIPKKPIKSDTPTTSIGPLCEPFATRNNKNSDDFTNNIQMMWSKKPKGTPQRCVACNYLDHYQNPKIFLMIAKNNEHERYPIFLSSCTCHSNSNKINYHWQYWWEGVLWSCNLRWLIWICSMWNGCWKACLGMQCYLLHQVCSSCFIH